MQTILIAAENGALPGGKVGGIGDVVRDLPRALADRGWQPLVLTPAYGLFSQQHGARKTGVVEVPFNRKLHTVDVIEIPGPDARVRHIAFEHPLFSPQGAGRIYCDDGPARPFATDASKFALLSMVAATYIQNLDEPPRVVHLHDWHAALFCLLRLYDARFIALRGILTVLTIHNLALQGIRPLSGDASSLESWYPELDVPLDVVVDPRYADCINPMAIAIRLADRINTVSPTYAREILRPSDPPHGFFGGEGLEQDLISASRENRLNGILNGCEYPKRDRRRPGWRRLLDTIAAELRTWQRRNDALRPIHDQAMTRLGTLPIRRPANIVTSIGRLTAQKTDLFLRPAAAHATALEGILASLGRQGVMIMVGSGDTQLQQRFADIAARRENFLFLCGYSESFSDMLYAGGDLFLMPSSFEPCGISQMLAMRSAQPCVVHAVGGLKDTVQDGVTGFSFGGATPDEQAENFVKAVQRALDTKANDQDLWLRVRQQAEAQRFTWQTAAGQYIRDLYEDPRA
jgi:starch synthase